MRRFLVIIVAAVLVPAASIHAAELMAIARPHGAPATLGEAMQRLTCSPRFSIQREHTQVISADGAEMAFLIPVAGNAQGSNGTYYRSDIVLGNFRGTDQQIGIGWMAQGQDNTNREMAYFTLPASTIDVEHDFVHNVVGETGLGAVFITGVKADGSLDDGALLHGYSRIWTPQPNAQRGTVSQSFSAVTMSDLSSSSAAYTFGLRQDGSFRTNVGVVNLDSTYHTWTISSLFNTSSMVMLVPPYSLVQSAVPGGYASASGDVMLRLSPDAGNFYWSAYGTSTDNGTGDGWVAKAVQ